MKGKTFATQAVAVMSVFESRRKPLNAVLEEGAKQYCILAIQQLPKL